jgi:hypothetical protein
MAPSEDNKNSKRAMPMRSDLWSLTRLASRHWRPARLLSQRGDGRSRQHSLHSVWLDPRIHTMVSGPACPLLWITAFSLTGLARIRATEPVAKGSLSVAPSNLIFCQRKNADPPFPHDVCGALSPSCFRAYYLVPERLCTKFFDEKIDKNAYLCREMSSRWVDRIQRDRFSFEPR